LSNIHSVPVVPFLYCRRDYLFQLLGYSYNELSLYVHYCNVLLLCLVQFSHWLPSLIFIDQWQGNEIADCCYTYMYM